MSEKVSVTTIGMGIAAEAVAIPTTIELARGMGRVVDAIANNPHMVEAATKTIEAVINLPADEKALLAAAGVLTITGAMVAIKAFWDALPTKMREELAVRMPGGATRWSGQHTQGNDATWKGVHARAREIAANEGNVDEIRASERAVIDAAGRTNYNPLARKLAEREAATRGS